MEKLSALSYCPTPSPIPMVCTSYPSTRVSSTTKHGTRASCACKRSVQLEQTCAHMFPFTSWCLVVQVNTTCHSELYVSVMSGRQHCQGLSFVFLCAKVANSFTSTLQLLPITSQWCTTEPSLNVFMTSPPSQVFATLRRPHYLGFRSHARVGYDKYNARLRSRASSIFAVVTISCIGVLVVVVGTVLSFNLATSSSTASSS